MALQERDKENFRHIDHQRHEVVTTSDQFNFQRNSQLEVRTRMNV